MGHEYSKFRKYTYITFANMFIYINLLKSELVHFCVNILTGQLLTLIILIAQ